jgi:CheY-like chemotaxis protein
MRKRRVIVFDDDGGIIELYRDIFQSLGYEVLAYTEPVVCPIYNKNADTCDKYSPCADILITDYTMPRMTGIDLLQAQCSRGCKLTVQNKALITGCADEDKINKIKDLGCAMHLKPLTKKELETWIHACEKRMDLTQPLGLPKAR